MNEGNLIRDITLLERGFMLPTAIPLNENDESTCSGDCDSCGNICYEGI